MPKAHATQTAYALQTYVSPLGKLSLVASDKGLCGLYFEQMAAYFAGVFPAPTVVETAFLASVREQLDAYFAGQSTGFNVPLEIRGTPFQQRVWQALSTIPHGSTVSYGELARQVGSPRACRAIGRTVGLNPLAIVLPCHRVIGRDGRLTGFAGGLPAKRLLLDLERSTTARQQGDAGVQSEATAPAFALALRG